MQVLERQMYPGLQILILQPKLLPWRVNSLVSIALIRYLYNRKYAFTCGAGESISVLPINSSSGDVTFSWITRSLSLLSCFLNSLPYCIFSWHGVYVTDLDASLANFHFYFSGILAPRTWVCCHRCPGLLRQWRWGSGICIYGLSAADQGISLQR